AAPALGATATPAPPFQFLREDMRGTSPKVIVRDSRGLEWRVKGGLEARPEAFATRLVAAMGYIVKSSVFMKAGKIEGVTAGLRRASGFVSPDGTFTYASFELVDPEVRFLEESWTWEDSPFSRTPELDGLKILVMLVSNWDNKDARDVGKGSNTSIIEKGSGAAARRYHIVNDWGQSLGSWGRLWSGFGGRQPWSCEAFSRQTLVTGLDGDKVQFGYAGQHTTDFKQGITVADVRWLMGRLGRVSEAQIRAGLRASGATPQEENCFTRALRSRIDQLRGVAEESNARR
ncbi:MAG TPA: hypothetical protein VER03_15585, partial [Bryobacteraceae bacterium]|nr:hypothetical protein [Bryobacteraceae bacterium]